MNLALLSADDLSGENSARLTGRRRDHLANVLRAGEGDTLPVGLEGGPMGTGTITRLTGEAAELSLTLDQPAPAPLPLTLILAMPRPKMFRRVLQTVASLGIKDIWLINSYKVEKSFWQTPWLSEGALRENLTLGLEQAKDTGMPQMHLRKLFKPFVEDELPELLAGSRALVAHPGTAEPCPSHMAGPATLCVGPEGGFTDYEVGKLNEAGCASVHLGPRILRVETAVPVLLSRLFDACV